ncbi:GGDEF domain-containing protein [Ruminococcus sp.]|uniref:GGDEF domain-containing protein n=1 Tax=Ruminococcus sp. TaxID=41978 RepID=UPI0025E44F3F|nr:GGDEF domain-containing protein [Ruminococcus sp.]MBQ9543367.1 GGDEF domain-containing protein [Ruminococcus sp.]
MAINNSEKKEKGRSANVFLIAGIALLVFVSYSIFLGIRLYNQMTETYGTIQRSLVDVSTIKDNLLVVNRDVVMIISGTGNVVDNVHEISTSFDKIDECMADYEKVEDRYEKEQRRYNQAKTFINAYHDKILAFQEQFMSGKDKTEELKLDTELAQTLYIQELQPLQITALEMFDAAKDIGQANSEKQLSTVYKIVDQFVMLMFIVLVAGETAIIIMARIQKAQVAKIEKREKELEAFDSKLKVSKRKMNEMAVMNILTGMKNRYALDEDISGRLETDNMCVTLLDIDNFRQINDIYGYDFGDEFLGMVSDKLKEEFSEHAELYNIQGNQFCLVFKDSVAGSQAMRLSEQAMQVMNNVYTISNIGLQLSATGSFYNYHARECANLSALLVKMISGIRQGKARGGNVLITVM